VNIDINMQISETLIYMGKYSQQLSSSKLLTISTVYVSLMGVDIMLKNENLRFSALGGNKHAIIRFTVGRA
jgi:hypothetical protein